MANLHPSLDPRAAANTSRALWVVKPTPREALRADPTLLPWTVTRNGEAMGNFYNQAQAVAFAVTACRSAADHVGQRSSLRIMRGRDSAGGKRGTIREERTFPRPSDPRKTPG